MNQYMFDKLRVSVKWVYVRGATHYVLKPLQINLLNGIFQYDMFNFWSRLILVLMLNVDQLFSRIAITFYYCHLADV